MTTFSTSTPIHEANGSHTNPLLPGILEDEVDGVGETGISVLELEQYVEKKKANQGKGFHSEYKVMLND